MADIKTKYPDRLAYIASRYHLDSTRDIARALGITKNAVIGMARRAGLTGRRNDWSQDQIDTLIRLHGTMPHREIGDLIGRSTRAVTSMMHEMGLVRAAVVSPADHDCGRWGSKWTADDVALLRRMYPEATSREIACTLSRSKSAVEGKAAQLGLTKRGQSGAAAAAVQADLGAAT